MPTDTGSIAAPAGQSLAPLLARHARAESGLLQLLREVQEQYGHVPAETIPAIAAHLGVPEVRVRSVASFYSFLHLEPQGDYRVLFSDNITDRMLGSEALLQQMCRQLWVEPGKLSEDGIVSVDTTSCTGMCDQGPALLVNGRAITRLTQQRVQEIGHLIRNRTPLADWPDDFFRVEDNIRRRDMLLDSKIPAGDALRNGLALGAAGVVDTVKSSGLRGRGGAGFPTGMKWESTRAAADPRASPAPSRTGYCSLHMPRWYSRG